MKRISKTKLTAVTHYYTLVDNNLKHSHWCCEWNLGDTESTDIVVKCYSHKKDMPQYAIKFIEEIKEPSFYRFSSSIFRPVYEAQYGSVNSHISNFNIYSTSPICIEDMVSYQLSLQIIGDYNLSSTVSPDDKLNANNALKNINKIRKKYGNSKASIKLKRKRTS